MRTREKRLFLSLQMCTGYSGKKCVFHSPLQPIPRQHFAEGDLQSSQRNASVQSTLLVIIQRPIEPNAGEGQVAEN